MDKIPGTHNKVRSFGKEESSEGPVERHDLVDEENDGMTYTMVLYNKRYIVLCTFFRTTCLICNLIAGRLPECSFQKSTSVSSH